MGKATSTNSTNNLDHKRFSHLIVTKEMHSQLSVNKPYRAEGIDKKIKMI